jgi:hypothetical protein
MNQRTRTAVMVVLVQAERLKQETAVPPTSVTFVLIARIPPEGISTFTTYEDHVLPLLAEHGGVLQRRLRAADGTVEIHVLWFPSVAALARFRKDPRRVQHAPKLTDSGASIELLQLEDVTPVNDSVN